MNKMADKQFSNLQNYVNEEQVTAKNLHPLDIWCSRGDKVYLTIYLGNRILYVSPMSSKAELDPVQFDPSNENLDREYALVFSDATPVRAFLYYYSGDSYYYWVIVLSSMIAFLIFSLCFITFVHRKLRYVKQLKSELDILAGGDLHYHVTVRGEDELGELAAGVEQMRRSILAHQEAEERMRSANSQLVTAMSHDLRTPLTSLLAYLELMDRGKYEGETQLRHFISRSLEKTLRIRTMADKLFEYFLVYSSEWEQPKQEELDADAVFSQFWSEYTFALESLGFSVKANFAPLSGRLRGNLDLLRRAFDNLYSNLLKYADPSQGISISYQREDDLIRLTAVNGVAPNRDNVESTNIGLNTCERILQYHGGTFSSVEEDGQFRVTFTLPLFD